MEGISEQFLDALTAVGRRAAGEHDPGEALEALGNAVRDATGAEAVVIRLVDEAGLLMANTVVARSEALAAELAAAGGDELPEAVRRAVRRARAADALFLPAGPGEKPLGSLELLHARRSFTPAETTAARLAASYLGLVLYALLGTNGAQRDSVPLPRTLALAGDALAAGLDEARAANEIVRIAARAVSAQVALLWCPGADGELELLATGGAVDGAPAAGEAEARRVFEEHEPLSLTREGGSTLATVALGQPPAGVLQLVFPTDVDLDPADLHRLTTFGVRAAQALRSGERTRSMALELERAEALLVVVGQAIAKLSLAHTLETAVARVSELLRSEHIAVYLREGTRLRAAAGRGVGEADSRPLRDLTLGHPQPLARRDAEGGHAGRRRAPRRRCSSHPHGGRAGRPARPACSAHRRRASGRAASSAAPAAAAGRDAAGAARLSDGQAAPARRRKRA